MKKIILLYLVFLTTQIYSQTDYFTVVSPDGSTSQNGRAPQGAKNYVRSIWLITAAEMQASGFTSGTVVNSIGFSYFIAQNIPTTGTFSVYMQNTTDVTNGKSTTWATAITGMTQVSNGSITIPAVNGNVDFPFSNGTSFTYTGGGIYVAYDYQNPSTTIATTANTAYCNITLTNGVKSATSSTLAPTVLTSSNYRPVTRLGMPVICARPSVLSTNNATLSSTDLNWTTGSNSSIVEWGPYNFTLGTGTTLNNVTSPYSLTGLTNSTAYEYYAKSNCGSGINSIWQGPYPFHTIFSPATPLYTTSFENEALEGFPFIGWLATPSSNIVSDWNLYFGGVGNAYVQDGASCAYSFSNTTAISDSRLYSRGFNLTAGTSYTIRYYVRTYNSPISGTTAASTNTASYVLSVGNDQTVASQTTVLATETGLNLSAFTAKSYNFTPSSSGVYYFSFLQNSPINNAGSHAFFVDNLMVYATLSTKTFNEDLISIAPNPIKNYLSIQNSNSIVIDSIKISDANGRLVSTFVSNQIFDNQINISDLNSGIYFITLYSKEGSVTKKIVKE